jgi:hypothetical protein
MSGLEDFSSYEEYLDSKLEEQQRSPDAIDRAYHRLQLLWSFEPAKRLLTPSQFLTAKQEPRQEPGEVQGSSRAGRRERLGREAGRGLEALGDMGREGEQTLLYVHVVHPSGAEVSGHIDLSHRLQDPGFRSKLQQTGALCPAAGDITFYNWRSSSLRSANIPLILFKKSSAACSGKISPMLRAACFAPEHKYPIINILPQFEC